MKKTINMTESTTPQATIHSTSSGQYLRKRAEEIARETAGQLPGAIDNQTPAEIRQTLHELRVHQIELDMQNEELRLSQVELEASRASYFDLYDMAPVGYLTVSEKGMIIEANLTAANLLGVTKKRLILQLLTRFIIKEDQEIYYRQRKILFETEASQSWGMRMLKKDGTVFWAWLEASTAQDSKSAPICRVVLINIDERKRLENEAREKEDVLREVLENSLDVSYKRNLQNNSYEYLSSVFTRISGFTPDEFSALPLKAVLDSIHTDDQAEVERVITESMSFATGKVHEVEYRFKRKDGQYRWFHDKFIATCDESGHPLARIGSLSDITDRKQAEAERESYQMSLETIFNTVPDCILTVDREMRVLQHNEAFKIHTCMNAPLASLLDLPIPCSRACHAAIRETLTRGNFVREYRVVCERADRPEQVSMINCSPLNDRLVSFIGALVVIRDITAITRLEQRLGESTQHRKIVGAAPVMKELFRYIDSLANQDTMVLITGESGTGKGLVAEALHYGGRRSFKPFVKVNCSALVENLLESELFGHVKGAFTGATRSHAGWFQKAHGGTIFLDEIGDISPRIQLKLLRVLEEKTFEPVGDTKPIHVDIRIITATNQNLQEKMKRGEFREDLFHRLNVMQLNVPPLRERREDITLLTDHFLAIFSKQFAKTILGVANDVMNRLLECPWPGNVRELENALERACLLCQGAEINLKDLPIETSGYKSSVGTLPTDKTLDHQSLLQILSQTEGNVAKAARLLGVSRPTLYRKMAEAGLTRMVRP